MVTVQLEAFLKDPDSIPERISTLSDNLNSLASWMSSASQVPLLIDYLTLDSPDSPLPREMCIRDRLSAAENVVLYKWLLGGAIVLMALLGLVVCGMLALQVRCV